MRKFTLCVILLSFALCAGCGNGTSDSAGKSGVIPMNAVTGPTATVDFALDDFTGVLVSQPFVASIVSGPFSVRVTVDSSLIDLLDVGKRGQVLEIGFQKDTQSQIERHMSVQSATSVIEISMPMLTIIDLKRSVFATISDFSGSVLEVRLGGLATLEGKNLSYDLLLGNVNATESVLLMEDVSPFPAADINLVSFASATVNMMDNGVLTGSAIEASSLSYYGSNVAVSVVADSTSSVVQLGPSRP